jgi:hypothetical protein
MLWWNRRKNSGSEFQMGQSLLKRFQKVMLRRTALTRLKAHLGSFILDL